MPNFNDDVVERIKDRADIVEFISKYIKLEKSGSNYVGLCPFHNEKTPSFTVNEEKGFFHCFGCGAGGDILEFVKKKENLNFPEALELLGNTYGIEVKQISPEDEERKNKREKSYDINRQVAKYYLNNLMEDKKALKYLNDRGITNKTIRRFGLGYAKDGWEYLHKYMKDEGYDDKDLENLGLLGKRANSDSYYDRFRNRIIFPIIDTRSRVIGFGGRVLDDSLPKYLNSPDTLVFNKGMQLYGLNFIARKKKKEKIILVEGYMDVLSLYNYGIDYSVASLGTALTSEQVRLIKRYGEDIYICYDSDIAGINATSKAISLFLKEGISPKIILLDEFKDPDEFLKEKGVDKFQEKIDNALHFIDYKIYINKNRYDLNDIEDKIKFTIDISKDLKLLDNPIELDVYISKISEDLNITREAIEREIDREKNLDRRKKEGHTSKKVRKDRVNYDMKSVLPKAELRAEIDLIRIMMIDKEYFDIIESQDIFKEFDNPTCRWVLKILEDIYFDEEFINKEKLYKIAENKSEVDKNILNIIIKDEESLLNLENMEQILRDLIRTLKISKLERRRKDVRDQIEHLEKNMDEIDINIFSHLLKELTSLNEELEDIRYEDRR